MLQRKEFGNAHLDIKEEAVLQPLGCCVGKLKHPSTVKPQCSMEDCLNCLLEETDMLRKTENLEDPVEHLGAKLVKQADVKTKDLIGNGTTTSVVIAWGCIAEGIKVVVAGASPNAITEVNAWNNYRMGNMSAEAGALANLKADKRGMGVVAKGADVLVMMPHSCKFIEYKKHVEKKKIDLFTRVAADRKELLASKPENFIGVLDVVVATSKVSLVQKQGSAPAAKETNKNAGDKHSDSFGTWKETKLKPLKFHQPH